MRFDIVNGNFLLKKKRSPMDPEDENDVDLCLGPESCHNASLMEGRCVFLGSDHRCHYRKGSTDTNISPAGGIL